MLVHGFLLFLFIFGLFQFVVPETEMLRHKYSLSMEHLDRLYLQTSITVLLKAKAKKELVKLPKIESILFERCAADAKQTSELAQCVHRLIREREKQEMFRRETQFMPSNQTVTNSTNNYEFSSDDHQEDLPTDSRHKLIILPISNLANKKLEQSRESDLNSTNSPESLNTDSSNLPSNTSTPSNNTSIPHFNQQQKNNRLQIFKLQTQNSETKLKISSIKHDKTAHKRWMYMRLTERYQMLKTKHLKFDDNPRRRKINLRRKREIQEPNTSPRKCTKQMKNVENLKHVQEYLQSASDCVKYLRQIGQKNAEFLSSKLELPVTYNSENLKQSLPLNQLEQFVQSLESNELSFLSPKIMNVLPIENKQQMFSPTILSFQDEGLVPLPKLLSLISTNECELLEWIDFFISMTGASHRLRQILDKFGPDLQFLRDQIQPKVNKLRESDKNWAQIGLNSKQRESMREYGYAPMTNKQLELAYKNKENDGEDVNEFFRSLKDDKNDLLLENFIEELASTNNTSNGRRRRKRETRVFAPTAFTGNIAEGIILNNNILSPTAFSLQLLRPRALGTNIVEARAFVASILAPNMLLARVLYPSAFRLTLLTPHALNTYILVPEAFLANILSPKVLSSRVLSIDAFTVFVLSPSAGTTQVLSPHVLSYRVLSPSILSANFLSPNILTLDVLSPSFLAISDESLKNGTLFGGSGDAFLAQPDKGLPLIG